MIKIEESYELFIDTLSRLDEKKLGLNDEELAYEIFEELDSEYHSFLHENTVNSLIEKGLISRRLRQRILNLRESIRPIMESKHDINLYRNDSDWKGLRDEANSIINEITIVKSKGSIIKHDIWCNKKGLSMLCFSDELGAESRTLLEPDYKVIDSFYADSHFDAMTEYYELMDLGVYETEFEVDKELYNLEEIKKRNANNGYT